MKLIILAIIVVFADAGLVFGQSEKKNDTLEREIRKHDLAEANAILRGDFAALNKILAADFTVNTPGNKIAKGREAVFTLIRNGTINYSSFVREPETFLFYENTVVVMGLETIKPTGTEQTVRRRYTNIWMKKKGKWLLTARHANIICPN